MGKIKLNNMTFVCKHGACPHEYEIAQKFIVNVCLETDGVYEAGANDDLTKTVHYGEAFGVIESIMLGEHVDLLETLCHKIGYSLLLEYEIVKKVKVEVIKVQPPIPNFNGTAAVKMKFKR